MELEISAVFNTKGKKKKLYISTVLQVVKLIPIWKTVNISETTIHVTTIEQLSKWRMDGWLDSGFPLLE